MISNVNQGVPSATLPHCHIKCSKLMQYFDPYLVAKVFLCRNKGITCDSSRPIES